MAKPLLSINELLHGAWEKTKQHWSHNLQISMGFLGLALLSFVLNLVAYQVFHTIPAWLRLIDTVFIQGLGSVWVAMKLTRAILVQDMDKKGALATTDDAKTLLQYAWVGILGGLAALGGALFFVLPGIWLTILLGFGTYLFLEQGITGTQALAASAALVKGRWWGVFARTVFPALLVTIILAIVLILLQDIVQLIAGYNPAEVVADAGASYWWLSTSKQVYMAYIADQTISAIGITLFSPIYLALSVRLFHELKKTA